MTSNQPLCSSFLFIAALCLAGTLFGTASMRAQTPAAGAKTAQQLYQEANEYIQKKTGGRAVGASVMDFLKEEQRTLATRHAAELAARTNRTATDDYCLGLLHHLAGDAAQAAQMMRRLLAEQPDFQAVGKQSARAIVAMQALKENALEEAERMVNEYAANQPQTPENRYAMETELAQALFQAKKYEGVPPHARAAFESVKQIKTVRTSDVFERDKRLMGLSTLMADAFDKLKRKEEALDTIREVKELALDLPSASLYRLARQKLQQMGKASEADSLFPLEKARYEAPEPLIDQWLDAERMTLAELRGNVVVLDFWATWCGPCRRTFPLLSRWQEKHKGKGLKVIGLTQLYGTQDGVRMAADEELRYLKSFQTKNGLNYHIGVAKSQRNSFNYSVNAIPTTVLIDRRGMVRFISVGVTEEELSLLDGMVNKLLKEPSGN